MASGESGKDIAIRKWLARLSVRDPALYKELTAQAESKERSLSSSNKALLEAAPRRIAEAEVSFETIVQKGRPALFVLEDRIEEATPLGDPVSQLMVQRVMDAADRINPFMPLIGRIDVANHPAGFPYVGTGWLIQPGLLCTNRHVAELIGRCDGRQFTFSRGRFGKELGVTFNRRHERDPGTNSQADSFNITRIAWIEPAGGPDLALLHVDMPDSGGTVPRFLTIADHNGTAGDDVVTIGYPARAYEDAIPDQQWMDEIYGGIYDVKRAAPGQLDTPAENSTTYDCTTLGGASGSPVLSLTTGKVVALHYAGLYKIENYGVPADVLRRYSAGVPSTSEASAAGTQPANASILAVVPTNAAAVAAPTLAVTSAGNGTVSVTVPLTITVSLGAISGEGAASIAPLAIDEAVARLAAEQRVGVLAVKAGFDGEADCIVVAAAPDKREALRAALPERYFGHPLVVRFATIDEQLGLRPLQTEASSAIVYSDAVRSDPVFAFDSFTDDMEVIAHVGPEQSFDQLKDFIAGAQTSLTSSMYQFFSAPIAAAVEERLHAGVRMQLVMDPATRDTAGNDTKPGEFDRSKTFERWSKTDKFEHIYVRKGSGGLVGTAYHIKVTVRDAEHVWLSSGNWTRSSQPFPAPSTHSTTGNREWHIIVRSKRLADMYRAHIKADFKQCADLNTTQEAYFAEQLVDVPLEPLVEARVPPPAPLRLSGPIKIMPILTPDHRGRVYTDAVLSLIRAAREQLLFQNQYIKIRKGMAGNLGELVDAVVEQSRAIGDVRVILRAGDVDDDVTELHRRGMDVMKCVRVVANTHTKGIIVDGRRVLIGSQNWSADAVTLNRDASLLFDDARVAEHFRKVFEIDWARARPALTTRAESPQRPVLLATRDSPPPGYQRMTLSDYRNG